MRPVRREIAEGGGGDASTSNALLMPVNPGMEATNLVAGPATGVDTVPVQTPALKAPLTGGRNGTTPGAITHCRFGAKYDMEGIGPDVGDQVRGSPCWLSLTLYNERVFEPPEL